MNRCDLSPSPTIRATSHSWWEEAEGAGVARVPADGAGAVPAVDGVEPVGDVGHRLVPADRFEAAVSFAAQQGGDRSGSLCRSANAMPLGQAKPCETGWSLSGRSATSFRPLDGGDHAAQQLADAAEGRLVFGAGHAPTLREGRYLSSPTNWLAAILWCLEVVEDRLLRRAAGCRIWRTGLATADDA